MINKESFKKPVKQEKKFVNSLEFAELTLEKTAEVVCNTRNENANGLSNGTILRNWKASDFRTRCYFFIVLVEERKMSSATGNKQRKVGKTRKETLEHTRIG
ncbi:MAG: hypothetical protein HQM08_08020 [Candidatus Riflebacteria bacterium]|nr:hypothetical protein [Candidatus Riflebacteria bacterium]